MRGIVLSPFILLMLLIGFIVTVLEFIASIFGSILTDDWDYRIMKRYYMYLQNKVDEYRNGVK